MATRQGTGLVVLDEKGGTLSLEAGPEEVGKGPWVLYSISAETILVANHHLLKRYALDGAFFSESVLTDELYEQELFPHSWHLTS